MAQTRFVSGAAFVLGMLFTQACSNDDPEPSDAPASGGSNASASTTGGSGGAPAAGQGGSAASTGGTSAGSGGAPAATGGTGGIGGTGGEPNLPTDLVLTGTSTRPLLAEADAANFELLDYLASAGTIGALTVDNWDPTAGVGDVATFTSNFRVAATGGTHTTVQAAITAAVTAGGTARQYIEVSAGTYREVICVPPEAPPITLYSTNADASQTVIAFDNYSGKAKAAGTPANPCNPSLTSETFGTSGSATFAAYSNDFQAKNITFSNDFDETTASNGLQAVALMTQADRVVFENVRVLGNQDTLYLRTGNINQVLRVYFKGCYVEGDTDFIFGRGTGVLDGCTIQSLTSRTASGVVIAPSTDHRNAFGILVINSTFTGDAGAAAGSTALGRAWDESQMDVATYTTNVAGGTYPNGQATVRDSTLGAHIQPTSPWRPAATTSRAYSSVAAGGVPANRLYEFGNTGPGSATP